MKEYDVIIVGAGIVGLSLALGLDKNTDLRIAIVDAVAPVDLGVLDAYDARVFAINKASQKYFQGINVWDSIVSARVSPYYSMEVWDAAGSGNISFSNHDVGESDLGHIIEQRVLRQSLLKKLKLSKVSNYWPLSLAELQNEADGYQLRTEAGDKFSTKLLIAADGANSWVRKQVAIKVNKNSYGHQAIVATVATAKEHQSTAWQRFMSSGPLAFLPLTDSRTSSIVWSTLPEHAQKLLEMDDSAFKNALGEAFSHRLGDIRYVSDRKSFPLYKSHAQQYVKESVALVGDAAHTVHPLAGQGLNLGLQDVAKLVEVIATAINEKRSFYSRHTLRAYERDRNVAVSQMLLLMDGFKTGFASKHPLLRWARNVGLSLADKNLWIKQELMKVAMG